MSYFPERFSTVFNGFQRRLGFPLSRRRGGAAAGRQRQSGRVRHMATLSDVRFALPPGRWRADMGRFRVTRWESDAGEQLSLQLRPLTDHPLRRVLDSREKTAAYFARNFAAVGFKLLACRVGEADGQPAAAVIATPEEAAGQPLPYLGAISIPLRRYAFVINVVAASEENLRQYVEAILPTIKLSAVVKADQRRRWWR
ncbi:MAG: hypothetical protein KC425_00835 [Anaerolineales bacterium]|nr:hypothetical protein [Anaerolineales bacterium]